MAIALKVLAGGQISENSTASTSTHSWRILPTLAALVLGGVALVVIARRVNRALRPAPLRGQMLGRQTAAAVKLAHWIPRDPAVKDTARSMQRNLRKTLEYYRARSRDPRDLAAYPTWTELLEMQVQAQTARSLRISPAQASHIGIRTEMQDAHSIQALPEVGALAGLCDGHGRLGAKVSATASHLLMKNFEQAYRETSGHAFHAMELTFYRTQADLSVGSACTAVLNLFRSNTLTVAALCDSETHVYCKIKDRWVAIPGAKVRNWGCPTDEAYARTYHADHTVRWKAGDDPKDRRVNGANVSRRLGGISGIRKPGITQIKLLPGCRVITCCDGVRDFVPEWRVLQIVAQMENEGDDALAETLLQESLKAQRKRQELVKRIDPDFVNECGDNVSVLVFSVKSMSVEHKENKGRPKPKALYEWAP